MVTLISSCRILVLSAVMAALGAVLSWPPALAATPAASASTALTGAAEPEPRVIYFRNECAEAIETAIHYQAMDDTWRMSRWITLAPGDERPVGRTKADVYYSTARQGGVAMAIDGRKARAVVYGDEAPSLFGVRSLEMAGQGDVLQVFRCAKK